MNIQNIDLLVDEIYRVDKETAKQLIQEYGNVRCEHAIEKAWYKAMNVWKALGKCRQKRMRDEILNFDDINGVITLKEFIKWYAGVEDELGFFMRNGGDRYREVCSSVLSTMSNRLGDIRIDRRILFSND